jgi:hypothetical protein
MTKGKWLRGLMAASVACATGAVHAAPVSEADVPALAARADVIVVGRTSVAPHNGAEWSETLLIKADRIIKGSPLTQAGALNAGVDVRQNPPIADQQYGVFFLNALSNGHYQLTDPAHPFFLAAPSRHPSTTASGTAVDQVSAELVHVLATPPGDLLDLKAGVGSPIVSASESGKAQAIYATAASQLQSIPAASKAEQLWALINSHGAPRERMWAALSLLQTGDVGALDSVKSDLLNPDADSLGIARALGQQIGASVNAPGAIPALQTLLGSSVVEVRRGAANALRNTGSQAAIAPLSGMLQDQDQMVRYYAATGLAAATHQPDRFATVDSYRKNESEHLAYWHKWSEEHKH